MEKLYIVMPAYNEEETIEEVIKEWYQIIEKHNGDGESRLVVIMMEVKTRLYKKQKS